MSEAGPIYDAGLKAGLEIAAAFVTGRADMATELRHHAVASALTSAARGILTLTPSDPPSEAKGAGHSPPPPTDRRIEALEAWEWLFDQKDLCLDRGSPPWAGEDDPLAWMVFRVSGNVNDREWDLVGHSSESPLAAVLAAKAAITGEKG